MTDDNWQARLLRAMDPKPAEEKALPVESPDPQPQAAEIPEEHHPGTATTLDERTAPLARHGTIHGDPLIRRCADKLRTIIGHDATRELEELATLAEHGNRAITTGRRIVVCSARGGAGKSTAAALLTTALAGLRRDPVLAVDADPDAGSLPLRLGPLGSGVRTAADGGIEHPSAFDQIARYLDRTATGVWQWPRALSAALGRQDEARAALLLRDRIRFLSRYFAVTVTDLGAGLHGPANRMLLADAHAVLVAGTTSLDGVLGAEAALRRLGELHGPGLLQRTVLVLTSPARQPGVDVGRAAETLGGYGAHVLTLPYDRHLALGAAVDQRRIAARTRTTALRIAAGTMDRAVLG